MKIRTLLAASALLVAAAQFAPVRLGGQAARPVQQDELPARKTPLAPRISRDYVPARTPWGDPDIAGAYTNSDESGIPFERPAEFGNRTLSEITPQELAEVVKRRQQQTIESTPRLSEFPGATSPLHWFENYNAANSRAWLVSDPPDGKVPAQTPEVAARTQARAQARRGRGPADSWEDRSLYDRCITRGIPGSMMPAIYGNSYDITQGPGAVVIRYEMVHEGRVIPLDRRQHLSPSIRLYLGDAIGRFEGKTLVVETTNFTDKTPYRGSSDQLKLTERFTPIGPETVEWSVTFDDPHTWVRPWTFTMNLTKVDASQEPFEYACHEGNYGLRNILAAARAEERAAAGR
jgi:hypothetical protein